MELFSYILICLILIWLSSNSLQEAAEFQLQDLNATTLFGQCIQYSDFFVCCQWNIRTKITRGDADILIPCEWPSWDSNTGIVDICTAGEEPDIPQALGALLGIWVLFRALEVGVWSVARAGPLRFWAVASVGRANRARSASGDFVWIAETIPLSEFLCYLSCN